jgi:hypothetical protein
MMRGWLLRGVACIIALIASAYVIDSLVFWHRMSSNGAAAFGSVQVYLTTPTKSNRLEIFTDQPQSVTCAHALFPHEGASPCWYASRHTTLQVK